MKLHKIAEQRQDKALIPLLEEMLEEAKKGTITGIAIVKVFSDEQVGHAYSGKNHVASLYMGLDFLKDRMRRDL